MYSVCEPAVMASCTSYQNRFWRILSVVPAIFPLKMFHTFIMLLCLVFSWAAWNWRLGQHTHTETGQTQPEAE